MRQGFVKRTIDLTIRQGFDLKLTSPGRNLMVPVPALSQWAHDNRTDGED